MDSIVVQGCRKSRAFEETELPVSENVTTRRDFLKSWPDLA